MVEPKADVPVDPPKLNPDDNELAEVVAAVVVAAPKGATDAVGNAGGAVVNAVLGAAAVLTAGAPNENPNEFITIINWLIINTIDI